MCSPFALLEDGNIPTFNASAPLHSTCLNDAHRVSEQALVGLSQLANATVLQPTRIDFVRDVCSTVLAGLDKKKLNTCSL